MCTSTAALIPSTTPVGIIEKPPFKSPDASALWDLGLHDKAARAEHNWTVTRGYKGLSGRTWRDNISSSMLRSDPQVAFAKARDKANSLQYFRRLATSGFTSLTFRLLASLASLDLELTQSQIIALRAQLRRILPKATDNLGAPDNHPTLKLVVAGHLTIEQLKAIQSLTPPNMKFTYTINSPQNLSSSLTSLASADLPETPRGRAQFEKLLDGIHQSSNYNITKEDRRKIVLGSPDNTNLQPIEVVKLSPDEDPPKKPRKKIDPDHHRNPETGELPTWISKRKLDEGVDLNHLTDDDWELIA